MEAVNLVLAVIVFVLVVTALRPPLNDARTALRPPWMPVMIITELAPLWFVITAVLLIVPALLGWMDGAAGFVAIVLYSFSLAGFVWMIARSFGTTNAFSDALATFDAPPPHRDVDPMRAFLPNPYRVPSDVRVNTVEYAPGYLLDVYRPAHDDSPTPRPVIIHVHGGSWSGGNREQQGRPLLHHLARSGWAAVSIDYPLVPAATFPEPLLGVHRALAWVRANADEEGFDPGSIVLTGGSSGAHLASLAALTDDHPQWGTRTINDPSIAGAITFYGVFDLLDRHGIRDAWPIVERGLIKADRSSEPARFSDASPIDHVGPQAPPFVVVHGLHDSLVPGAESRYFADALRAVSRQPVAYVALKGATHAFDAVPSIRTQLTVQAVARLAEVMTRAGAVEES